MSSHADAMLALPDTHWEDLIGTLGLANVGEILDVGCGAGAWLPALARVNSMVIGVEPDRAVVESARLRVSSTSNVRIQAMAAESLEFPPESFDAVVCFTVLPYLDHVRALAEMARVLRTNGRLVLGTVGTGYYARHAAAAIARGKARAIRYGVDPIIVTVARTIAGEHVAPRSLKAWTTRAVQRAVEAHGLRVDAVVRTSAAVDPTWPRNFLGMPMYFIVSATKHATRPAPRDLHPGCVGS